VKAASMARVTVTIGGRVYRMACDDGEEERLAGLARDLERRIQALRSSFGEVGDQRLTVMAALMLADELHEARRQLAGVEGETAELRGAQASLDEKAREREEAAARALGAAAARIERITRALRRSRSREPAEQEA
jgi:cell division protein ZapA